MKKHSDYFLAIQRTRAMKRHPQYLQIKRRWLGVRARTDKPYRTDSYAGVTLSPEWATLAGFFDWYIAQPGAEESWDLDKDILVPGNRSYSPTRCALVPAWLNTALANPPRGSLPRGVQYRSRNRVMASISKGGKAIRLGTFDDPMKAHKAWQIAKTEVLEAHILRYETERPSCYRQDVKAALDRRVTTLRLDIIHGRETIII